jgi:hypothetical protein
MKGQMYNIKKVPVLGSHENFLEMRKPENWLLNYPIN